MDKHTVKQTKLQFGEVSILTGAAKDTLETVTEYFFEWTEVLVWSWCVDDATTLRRCAGRSVTESLGHRRGGFTVRDHDKKYLTGKKVKRRKEKMKKYKTLSVRNLLTDTNRHEGCSRLAPKSKDLHPPRV